MIKAVTIENFMLYESAHFDFPNGITCIHGDNDAGKSTILLAVYWAVYGKPSHTKISDSNARVVVEFDNCTLERVVENKKVVCRITENGKLAEFRAMGTTTPDEIFQAIGMSEEINFQGQADNLWPLSLKPSDFGAVISGCTDIGEFWPVVTELIRERDRYNSAIVSTENIIAENVTALQEVTTSIRSVQADYDSLMENVNKLQELQAKSRSLASLLEVVSHSHNGIISLSGKLSGVSEYFKKLETLFDTRKRVVAELSVLEQAVSNINTLFEVYTSAKEAHSAASTDLILIEKQLPPVCSLCGKRR